MMSKKGVWRFLHRGVIILSIFLASCGASHSLKTGSGYKGMTISQLKWLDEYTIPFDLHFQNTWVGGLSGLDYDRLRDQYFIISDERSATTPARFYTAQIPITNNTIDTIIFTSMHFLKMPTGDTFPSIKANPVDAADPETIRWNPVQKNLVWASEGERMVRGGQFIVKDPWIWQMTEAGHFIDSFPIPSNLRMQASNRGPRVNGVFEGLSFTPDYRNVFVSVEEPLYEDGPPADTNYAGAPVRILKYDVLTKKPLGQFAYLLEPVAWPPKPADGFKVNGISEILSIDAQTLLVMERSFSVGNEHCSIKIFKVTLKAATDITQMEGLHQRNDFIPAQKTLLFNMDSLHRYIDNMEGLSFGPKLANGHFSLLVMADNNFNPEEKAQVFLFEIIP